MKGFGSATFGELNAEDYDALHDPGTTEASVALLAELAQGGKVLELAIGTGRIALPLTARGLSVQGVDASPDMVAKLRAKPGGEAIPVVIGDIADAAPAGKFDLIYLVFNTLFNLTSQDAQVRCFQNAAGHLSRNGVYVIEAFVPDMARFSGGQSLRTVGVAFDALTLEAALHDPVTQLVEYQYVRMTPQGTKLMPLPMRYAWPAEIDLMARLAGLELRHRWAGWERAPFTAESKMHVSVYGRAAA